MKVHIGSAVIHFEHFTEPFLNFFNSIFGDGVQLYPLGTSATNCPIYLP
jgi:hypothetical protein